MFIAVSHGRRPIRMRSEIAEPGRQASSLIALHQVQVGQHPARFYSGGSGAPLLLVHGGWGGSLMHWNRVWDHLALRCHVIAADLPGLGWVEQAPLASVGAYAEWLVALLDEIGIDRVWTVGNSFGASVAWSLAGRYPERCDGLILVNGVPMPRTPAPLLWCGRTRVGRMLMRALVRTLSYNPSAVLRGFVDPANVPPLLKHLMETDEGETILRRFADILIAGDGPPAPRVSPLLLWGKGDQLLGTSAKAARRLQRSIPGSQLRFIEKAGHFPQIEAPDVFLAELESYVVAKGFALT
jgi:pimeloyl-ACP methyl ester carboxylesterase